MQAWGVPAGLVPKAWPLVVDWVTEALAKGKADETPAEILDRLMRAKQQLWLAWDEELGRARGICITEMYDSARGKCCNLALVAGTDFALWRHLTEAVKKFARAQGCVRLEAAGRKGWERHAKLEGWNYLRTIIEMRLEDEQQQ